VSGHDIIVIGASAGGVEALVTLVGGLPADLPASIFVVLHIPPEGPSMLPTILGRSGPLVATHPVDGTAIEQRHIYVAPPDHHMLLEQGRIRVIRGPRENRHRPAIDPLFRSAGVAYGPRVVGVILTGSLDDGTAGLEAIKQRGGVAVVQNYTEALFSSMPHSAVEHVKVDYVLSLSAIAEKLRELAHEVVKESEESPVSRNMETEVSMAKMQIPRK